MKYQRFTNDVGVGNVSIKSFIPFCTPFLVLFKGSTQSGEIFEDLRMGY